MGAWRKCVHTVCGRGARRGQGLGERAPRAPRPASGTHVHDVQLGQQAAVSQRELVAIQEAAARLAELRFPRQLVLQGRAQVAVQPGKGAQQQLVEGWGRRWGRSEARAWANSPHPGRGSGLSSPLSCVGTGFLMNAENL